MSVKPLPHVTTDTVLEPGPGGPLGMRFVRIRNGPVVVHSAVAGSAAEAAGFGWPPRAVTRVGRTRIRSARDLETAHADFTRSGQSTVVVRHRALTPAEAEVTRGLQLPERSTDASVSEAAASEGSLLEYLVPVDAAYKDLGMGFEEVAGELRLLRVTEGGPASFARIQPPAVVLQVGPAVIRDLPGFRAAVQGYVNRGCSEVPVLLDPGCPQLFAAPPASLPTWWRCHAPHDDDWVQPPFTGEADAYGCGPSEPSHSLLRHSNEFRSGAPGFYRGFYQRRAATAFPPTPSASSWETLYPWSGPVPDR
eukprot:TRINITY_DN28470_c0_g1_i1.p1 TRINITY_DN28470_c0_g1~~TRINITY_DN28470_c0_g1_i1.p1  ORF type:complete len:308 (+),score=93.69 TRINITY_DN28470_c0_g1_i1:96-1019(+)